MFRRPKRPKQIQRQSSAKPSGNNAQIVPISLIAILTLFLLPQRFNLGGFWLSPLIFAMLVDRMVRRIERP
jgi:hypothetical protein